MRRSELGRARCHWLHPKSLCRFVAPYFAALENPQRLSHIQFATLLGASEGISRSLFLIYGRSAASGLPGAGAVPPQRPLQKHASPDRCAFFAALPLSDSVPAANQRRREEYLNGASGEGLVKHGAKKEG